MSFLNQQHSAPSRWDAFALDAASLISSVSFGQLFVAWPFLSQDHMGASSAQVGLIAALYQAPYVAAVLAGRGLLHRIDPRVQTSIASLVIAVAVFGMCFVTRLPGKSALSALMVLVAISGVATSWLWPPVMGRVATGLDGKALNRRLGRYNAAWSTGMVLGPIVGGYLYRWNITAPFWSAMIYHVVSAVLLWSCSPVRPGAPTQDDFAPSKDGEGAPPPTPVDDELMVRTRRFRNMARIALVCGYIALGLLRFQVPQLAETDLGMDSAQYGQIGTLMSFTMAAGFWMLGRNAGWHFRAGWLWTIQAGLGLSLLLAYLATSPPWLYVCGGLAGAAISFLYASHMYYGVAGGQRRSRLMAIHEVLVSSGFLIGAYGGGLVADASSLRAPYFAACGVIVAAVGLEMLLLRRGIQKALGRGSIPHSSAIL